MSVIRTYTEEEVKLLLNKAMTAGYRLGYIERKAGIDTTVKARSERIKFDVDKLFEKREEIFE